MYGINTFLCSKKFICSFKITNTRHFPSSKYSLYLLYGSYLNIMYIHFMLQYGGRLRRHLNTSTTVPFTVHTCQFHNGARGSTTMLVSYIIICIYIIQFLLISSHPHSNQSNVLNGKTKTLKINLLGALGGSVG